MEIFDPVFTPNNQHAVIKPYVLSHGTLEVHSLRESRKFYEEFLGLECVRHARPSMLLRCGMKWHIVAVEVGDKVRPCGLLNHWGIEVLSQEEVDQAHRDALHLKDKYGIRTIMEPRKQHGVYCFYMEDLDHNWWEVSYTENFRHDDHYDFGDRFPMDEPAGEVET
jgi:catechol 2,3-dioxygenase-like lactoylglutathione lyase family enzyme